MSNLFRYGLVIVLALAVLGLLVNSLSVAVAAPHTVFTVNTTSDDINGTCDAAHCSLREAIMTANANPGMDNIEFDLGTGIPSITITVALPDITSPVTMDGATGGATKVELNGNGGGYRGLNLSTGSSTGSDVSFIRNLVINRFNSDHINLQYTNGGIHLEGNWIGVDSSGTRQLPGGVGIYIAGGADNNNHVIGGPSPEQRNVIAGGYNGTPPNNSGNPAVHINSSFGGGQNITIENNYIGLNVTGTTLLLDAPAFESNGGGVVIGHTNGGAGTAGTIIRDNVIAGRVSGIQLGMNQESGIFNTTISSNKLGTDASGTVALPNRVGIMLFRGRGYNLIDNNLISGNSYAGIHFNTGGAGGVGENFGAVVQNNLIGTDITGQNPLPNGTAGDGGIVITGNSHDLTIQDNVIAFNTGPFAAGINHQGGTGVRISQNAIFGNTANDASYGLGIDLMPGGATPNDPDDSDTGPNNLQNFPVISSAIATTTEVTVTGALTSTPGTEFRLEFFGNTAADSTGFGEGQDFLGVITVTTNLSGGAVFTTTLPVGSAQSAFISATATDPNGNTSEFSGANTIIADVPKFLYLPIILR